MFLNKAKYHLLPPRVFIEDESFLRFINTAIINTAILAIWNEIGEPNINVENILQMLQTYFDRGLRPKIFNITLIGETSPIYAKILSQLFTIFRSNDCPRYAISHHDTIQVLKNTLPEIANCPILEEIDLIPAETWTGHASWSITKFDFSLNPLLINVTHLKKLKLSGLRLDISFRNLLQESQQLSIIELHKVTLKFSKEEKEENTWAKVWIVYETLKHLDNIIISWPS